MNTLLRDFRTEVIWLGRMVVRTLLVLGGQVVVGSCSLLEGYRCGVGKLAKEQEVVEVRVAGGSRRRRWTQRTSQELMTRKE